MTGPPVPTQGLLDTTVFIAVEQHWELDYGAVPLEQSVSSVTRGKLYAGVHAAITSVHKLPIVMHGYDFDILVGLGGPRVIHV